MNHAPAQASEAPAGSPSGEYRNYVTPRGMSQLQARRDSVRAELATLPGDGDDAATPAAAPQRAWLERELHALDQRLGSATEVDPERQPAGQVAFGATVTLDSEEGRQRWQIVGEDEADLAHGRVSYRSPLARALLGARVGDEVSWSRPAGDLPIEVLAIDYRDD